MLFNNREKWYFKSDLSSIYTPVATKKHQDFQQPSFGCVSRRITVLEFFKTVWVDHVHHLNIICLSGLAVNKTRQFSLAWVNHVHKQQLLAEHNLWTHGWVVTQYN